MRKAGALLARRPYSRAELQERLARFAGELPIDAVLDRLEQLNLLNDAEYAYNFAFCHMKQDGWGPNKIQHSLLRRHVEQKTIEAAIQRATDELGCETTIERYAQEYFSKKGLPADLKTLRRAIAHLGQRGFDEDSIMSVLRRMIPAKLWHRFETGESIE